ncbi:MULTISPECIES: CC_3452 family protein [unclassified Hyphomonas]|jgi:predicted double-glycine peptidase|uniref:CC_3452 family protein n=1 Tax=unclassified Hyphomonas TaxID=2630699 RepID=UPI000C6A2BEB|nr:MULTISPECIES: hypothetical protein [unclassified Hyphomonas]MAL47613.1 hypothetical protein [Hyphomonas sp.]MAX84986.1 hypothetical protein [Hyphomonas sp.]HAO35700.1 hypothetical protein [Hyphomonas sp.]HAW55641.1 hypothetical protein [Hyphomonas sp.]HBJ42470.1 hypothetical protein [Hyphomonas sp.]|tara:strand:- start:2290 stop:2583 length:294 start_codon:yes stop_codon:yes gene_type:complete
MIRSALTAAAFLALGAPAFANTFTFETVAPVDEGQVVAIGTVWLCEGTVCKGDLDRKKASVRDCKKIAKKAGEIISYGNSNSKLEADDIEACKKSAR